MSGSGMIVIMVLIFSACTSTGRLSVNTPKGKQNYPIEIGTAAQRSEAVQEAWRMILGSMQLPVADLELEPVINTPRSLPVSLAGKIKIFDKSGTFGELEAKESLRLFIQKNRGLLSGDPARPAIDLTDLTLESFNAAGGFYRARYRQTNYLYPIAEGYGELMLAVGKDGTLLQMSSRLIPLVTLPSSPQIDPQSTIEKMIGRSFSYSDIAGRPQTYKVAGQEEVAIKPRVIYPRLDGDRIFIHLAFPVEVGSGMTWTVYIDAFNGHEIAVRQNFAT